MSCCCTKSQCCKVAAVCLGRCDLPKHRCLDREEVLPEPVPKHMGWLYTAKGAPNHQLRCGWRPGHISNTVLRKITAHRGKCGICPGTCGGACRKSNLNPCGIPPKCSAPAENKKENKVTLSKNEPDETESKETVKKKKWCCKKKKKRKDPKNSDPENLDSNKFDRKVPDPETSDPNNSNVNKCERCESEPCKSLPCSTAEPSAPYLRVVRHAGRYSIITDPPDNSPSGPYPLKYVLNCDPYEKDDGVKFSLEAKYNDYCFDYTSSQNSFVLDFSPPEQRCYKPCLKEPCIPCATGCLAPC